MKQQCILCYKVAPCSSLYDLVELHKWIVMTGRKTYWFCEVHTVEAVGEFILGKRMGN